MLDEVVFSREHDDENEDIMIQKQVNKYIEDFFNEYDDEFKLLKEIGQLDNFINEIKYIKTQEILCRNRMNTFIDLASNATGRPYIIDSGSSYDVADELFLLKDEWLQHSSKKSDKRLSAILKSSWIISGLSSFVTIVLLLLTIFIK